MAREARSREVDDTLPTGGETPMAPPAFFLAVLAALGFVIVATLL